MLTVDFDRLDVAAAIADQRRHVDGDRRGIDPQAVDADGRTVKTGGRPLNWGGSIMLCTRDTQFEFGEQGDCGARGLTASGFVPIELAAGTGRTIRFGMP